MRNWRFTDAQNEMLFQQPVDGAAILFAVIFNVHEIDFPKPCCDVTEDRHFAAFGVELENGASVARMERSAIRDQPLRLPTSFG